IDPPGSGNISRCSRPITWFHAPKANRNSKDKLMFVLSRLLAKLAGIVFTILVIAIINFAVIHSAPGDPASVIAGQSGAADAKFIAQIRADYGLDQPFFNQLVTYVGKVLQFDLG